MEYIFIRHGHGEHLHDYPNNLNMLHPSLTDYGKFQVAKLREQFTINPHDLVVVSPTKRTIETALILTARTNFIVCPLVGPRMFPQNPELPFLACDHILSKTDLIALYGDLNIVDFNVDCWKEGINRIDQSIFQLYATQLLDWIANCYDKAYIISHDGTITNYRMLLGEKGLTRQDFLGEAGVYRKIVES